jgi:predicted dehydrogenase
MKKIKVAQIGTSVYSHGRSIWQTLLAHPELFEVVGYAFPENERTKFPAQMGDFAPYREMTVGEILADPTIEAVVVETEEIYLTKYARMVAEAGKHLHMEKPGGLDPEEFRALIATLKEKKLAFSTGYMYRFNPLVREALDRVKRGELGRIYAVEAHMGGKHPAALRDWLAAFPGGMTFFLGCHLIDLVYTIQGEPQEVIPLTTSTGIDGTTVGDYGMVVFRYPSGVSFIKVCDEEPGGFQRRQLVICGERGTIEIRPLELTTHGDAQYGVMSECFDSAWQAPWQTKRSEEFGRYDAMMENFAELVRGKENPYSYDYELGLYELLMRSCEMRKA